MRRAIDDALDRCVLRIAEQLERGERNAAWFAFDLGEWLARPTSEQKAVRR